MRTRPQRLARGGRSMTLFLFAGMVIASLVGASAASLGGLHSKSLFAMSVNQTAPPQGPLVLACDTFSLAAPTGTALVNRPVRPTPGCGAWTWNVRSGTWVIVNGDLDASSTDASATLPIGRTSMSVQATLVNSSGGGRAAGVAIDHSGAGLTFLAGMIVGNNQAHLRMVVNGGSPQTIASTNVTVGATSLIRLTRVGNVITFRVDGIVKITYTLTAAQAAQLTGTNAGLFWQRGNPLRFRNFTVTEASP